MSRVNSTALCPQRQAASVRSTIFCSGQRFYCSISVVDHESHICACRDQNLPTVCSSRKTASSNKYMLQAPSSKTLQVTNVRSTLVSAAASTRAQTADSSAATTTVTTRSALAAVTQRTKRVMRKQRPSPRSRRESAFCYLQRKSMECGRNAHVEHVPMKISAFYRAATFFLKVWGGGGALLPKTPIFGFVDTFGGSFPPSRALPC